MASHRRRRSLGSGRCRHRRGLSRQNVAVPWRGHPPVRFGWPADAGPVTTMPGSGGATFRGAGPIRGTVPRPAANHGPGRSHALPGFPGRPRRAARVFRCPPTPVPRTGRRPPAPARWWRTATARREACGPAPRSPACATAQVAPEPRGEGAVRLVPQPAPGHPHRMPSQHRAARLAEPLVVTAAPAREGHRRQPRGARQLPPVAQLPVEGPVGQHQRVVRADPAQPARNRRVVGVRRGRPRPVNGRIRLLPGSRGGGRPPGRLVCSENQK